MKLNPILQSLPKTVSVNGRDFFVNYGFKTGMQLDIILHDERFTETERYAQMLNLFYPVMPNDLQGAFDQMLWFFSRGRYDVKKGSDQKGEARPREFCFNQDAELILSGFSNAYGLDLAELEDTSLHWWRFMALFAGLPEDSQIQKYIYYRTCSFKGMSDSERKRVRKIRNAIAVRKHYNDSELTPAMRLQKRNERWLKEAEDAKRRLAQSDAD